MNRIRLFSSGALLLFAVYCLIHNPDLPFSLPQLIYIVGTVYFAVFPIKDMFSFSTNNSYKGRQFKKYYQPVKNYNEEEFARLVKRSNRSALYSMLFWLAYMSIPSILYLTHMIGREWIFFFFALSNFAIFMRYSVGVRLTSYFSEKVAATNVVSIIGTAFSNTVF